MQRPCVSCYLRPGRCHWQPVFRPRNLTPSGSFGRAVLAVTGHHAGGYLQDKVLGTSLVSCRKTTGFRPITGPLLIALGGSLPPVRLSLTVKWNQCPPLACGKDCESISQLSIKGPQKQNSCSVSSKSSQMLFSFNFFVKVALKCLLIELTSFC